MKIGKKLIKLLNNAIIRMFLLLGFEIKTCKKPTARVDDRFSYQLRKTKNRNTLETREESIKLNIFNFPVNCLELNMNYYQISCINQIE